MADPEAPQNPAAGEAAPGTAAEDDDRIEFGPFRLDRACRLLTKQEDRVQLGDRALDILMLLIAEAPNVVSGSTLIERVWPGIFVDESNLRFQMAGLRKALDDGRHGNRYISTVRGRGYCFVAPLARSPAGGELRPGSSAERAGAGDDVAGRPDTNLPHQPAAIIGRDGELADLRQRLAGQKLITLVGPGGVGKTRLAGELGWRVLADFPAGVWLVNLASLAEPEAVAIAAAAVLGASVTNADTIVEAIAGAIGRERRLLIFDNCEHLADAAAALIKSLLERVPNLSVLATSQRDLRLAAEQAYRLDPLAVPPAGASDIAGFGAVTLFVAQARAADRLFALHDGNSADIGEICRRLDGLPLALEMAAARVGMFGVEGLRRRLDDRLAMLKGVPTGDARHASLRAVLEWSHGLLEPHDQQVFRRLAVFPGGFSIDAALAVAGEEGDDIWVVVDALGRLIDISLIAVESREPPRYRLLETLRLYALERLAASGETEAVAERHAQYFATYFDEADIAWEATPEAEWFETYRPEFDNVRAALDWALAAPGRSRIAVSLGGGAALLWHALSLVAEGRRTLDRVIALIDEETPGSTAARLLQRTASLWTTADRPKALALLERSARLYRALGAPLNSAAVEVGAGGLYAMLGRYDEAEATLCAAEKVLKGTKFRRSYFGVINSLGILATYQNDTIAARRYLTQALDWTRSSKEIASAGTILVNLAELEYDVGNIDVAIKHGRAAVDSLRSTQRGIFRALALINLASYLTARDRLAEARLVAEEGLVMARNVGHFAVRISLQQWALLGALEERVAEAARLIGFVDAGYRRSGERRLPTEQRLHDRLNRLMEAALPIAEIDALRAEGAGWTEAEALDFAFRRLVPRG